MNIKPSRAIFRVDLNILRQPALSPAPSRSCPDLPSRVFLPINPCFPGGGRGFWGEERAPKGPHTRSVFARAD